MPCRWLTLGMVAVVYCRLDLAISFVIDEEEKPVPQNRPAERTAELIADQHRLLRLAGERLLWEGERADGVER